MLPLIQPFSERNPLERRSTRINATNTFVIGNQLTNLLALADAIDAAKVTWAIVTASAAEWYELEHRPGEIVRWVGHPLGSAGTKWYLDSPGAATVDQYTTTHPSQSSTARVTQLVATPLDADNVIFLPPNPFAL